MSARKRSKDSEDWTADKWYKEFFCKVPINREYAENYSVAFSNHGLRLESLKFLDFHLLREMNITKVGHVIDIINRAKEITEEGARSELRTSGSISSVTKRVNNKPVKGSPPKRPRREQDEQNRPSGPSAAKSPSSSGSGSPQVINIKTIKTERPKEFVEVSSTTERKAPIVPSPARPQNSLSKIRYPSIEGPSSLSTKKNVFCRLGGRVTPDGGVVNGQLKVTIKNDQVGTFASFTSSDQVTVLPHVHRPVIAEPVEGVKARLGGIVTSETSSPVVSKSILKRATGGLLNPLVTRVNPPEELQLPSTSERVPERKQKDLLFGTMMADQIEMEMEDKAKKIRYRLGPPLTRAANNVGEQYNQRPLQLEAGNRLKEKHVSFADVTVVEVPNNVQRRSFSWRMLRNALHFDPASGDFSLPVVEKNLNYL